MLKIDNFKSCPSKKPINEEFWFLKDGRLSMFDIEKNLNKIFAVRRNELLYIDLKIQELCKSNSIYKYSVIYVYEQKKKRLLRYKELEDYFYNDFLQKYKRDLNLPLDLDCKTQLYFEFNYNITYEEIKLSCCGELEEIDHEIACLKCGKVIDCIIPLNIEYLSYNDKKETTIFQKPVYKRAIHFIDKLKQKLSLSNKMIPQDIIQNIKKQIEIEKKMCTNISPEDIKKILKKLNLVKYYDSDFSIYKTITGKTILELDKDTLKQIETMFSKVETAFEKIENKGRTSMFIYDYTINKILEILGYNDHKKFFKPPKNPEKINEYDKLWKKICEYLDWEFVPTKRL